MADFLEVASPYVIGVIVGIAIGAGFILYKDRNFKQHIQCASCRKKMFSYQQDVESSDNFTAGERQNLAFMRHLVRSGQVTEDIQ